MVTALDTYLPFASGAGSNVTEDEWRDLAEQWFPTGVVHGYANEFVTTQRAAGANMSVDVATGQARIRGHEGISTSVKNLAVTANATGNPRIDTVVVRGDFVNDTIGLDVLAGTAAVNPVPPALTQNTSTWEIPLYDVFVAAAASSIATADLRDRRPQVFQLAQAARKEPVRLATAAAMAASTVVGNVRTANANGAMATIDGTAPAVGNRVLDKDNATAANRGIWRVTDLGSASQPWRMERPDDFDSSADVRDGVWVTVNEGTANASTTWLMTTNDPITLGTTGLVWAPISAIAGNAQGDLAYFNGTTWVLLPKGTAAQVLTMNGGATAPSWADLPASPATGPALIRTFTSFPPNVSDCGSQSVASTIHYTRVTKGGTITGIGVMIVTQAGSPSFAVCRGAVGRAAPTSRVTTSGNVACPAAGFATISIASTVVDETTDWLAFGFDGVNATVLWGWAVKNGNAVNYLLGYLATQTGTNPIPSSPSTSPGSSSMNAHASLIGVP